MLPRTRHVATRGRDRRYVWLCCRASHIWRRAVLRAAAHPCAARGRTLRCLSLCCRAIIHAAAQFYVRPRIGPLLPRSSPYFRALPHVTAQCYVLPRTYGATRGRTLRPSTCCRAFIHASCLRLCCRVVVWIAIKWQSVPRTMWTINHHHRHHHPITATTIIIIMRK